MVKLKISQKLPIIMVTIALVSSIVTGGISLVKSSKEAVTAAEEKLDAMDASKRANLSNYLDSIKQDLSSLSHSPYVLQALLDFKKGWDDLGYNQKQTLQNLYIKENPNPTGSKENLDYAKDGSLYSTYHKTYHPWFRHFLRQRDYYDIFLFDTNGNLVYTVFKENDYATNLEKGEYKDTDLGKAFRAAIDNPQADKQNFFDFKPYAPSYGAAASFISQPILYENGDLAGVLVFQMPIARIDSVMQMKEGMGKTGKTYLVGDDYLMRNNLYEEDTILKTKVETEAVKLALQGQQGHKYTNNYNGTEVISSYRPLEFLGTKFAIIAEIDKAEVMEPIRKMQQVVILVSFAVIAALAFIAIVVARSISSPITKMSGLMKKIADGESDIDIPDVDRSDEIGDMAQTLLVFKENAIEKQQLEEERKIADIKAEEDKKKAMHDLASRFEDRVQGMIQSVAAAATQLSQTAESMEGNINNVDSKSKSAAVSSGQTSQNVATVASASEEMSASVKEISGQVAKSTEVVNDAVKKADNAEVSAKALETASNEIGNVVKLIRDIAEQINLLALNATIESARAGEAGKGFAVVASEVKNLSNQATKATEDISNQIESVQSISGEVFSALNAIKTAVDKVNEYSGGISAAVEEQSATTAEIAQNMVVASKGTQEVNDNISDITTSSAQAKDSSLQMLDASRMLSQEAEQLSAAVSEFLSEVKNG